MQTNERGDAIISPDETLYNLVQEDIEAMQEGWLDMIPKLCDNIQDRELIQRIIRQLERLNNAWGSENVKDMIAELNGIVWLRMYKEGQKKKINEDTIKKFQ